MVREADADRARIHPPAVRRDGGAGSSLRDSQPWKAACEHDYAWLGGALTKHYKGDESDLKLLMGGIVRAFDGVTVEDYGTTAEATCADRIRPSAAASATAGTCR